MKFKPASELLKESLEKKIREEVRAKVLLENPKAVSSLDDMIKDSGPTSEDLLNVKHEL